MQITDYVKVINLVPKDVCQSVIELYKDNTEWEMHTWYDPIKNYTSSIHKKELDVLYPKNFKVLESYIGEAISNYHSELNSMKLITKFTNIRLNKYKTGTIMSEHPDLIRRHENDGVPVLSIVGLLNDDFEGGQFVMNGTTVNLSQGDILIFPSTFLYNHKVEEVKSGTRYSFVSWAY